MAIELGFSDSISFEKLVNTDVILVFAIWSFAFIVAIDFFEACSFKIVRGVTKNCRRKLELSHFKWGSKLLTLMNHFIQILTITDNGTWQIIHRFPLQIGVLQRKEIENRHLSGSIKTGRMGNFINIF